MLGRWFITILIGFQCLHLQATPHSAPMPGDLSSSQETEEEKKKKKKKDEEQIADYFWWQASGVTLLTSGVIQGVITLLSREKGKDAEKKLEIQNEVNNIERLRTRIQYFASKDPSSPIEKLKVLDKKLNEVETALLKLQKNSKEVAAAKNKYKELQTELKIILDDLNLDLKKYNEIKATHNQPTYTTEVAKPNLKNNQYHFPGIIEDRHDDLVPEKTTKNELSREQALEKIPSVCNDAYKQLAGVIKNKTSQIPKTLNKFYPSLGQGGIGLGMLGYAYWGTYKNNIKNLGEAKKIIDKKQELETTQKVTLENLIKEESKKLDTILEPFVTYTADILTSNKDSIKQSIQTNFRFNGNSQVIKEKIEQESKNFENPDILKNAILKALAISGDASKTFTIDELEKKIYNHNPLDSTTEYPKFLRKFYSEAIRQLYPLTMVEDKREYISADIFTDLVEKTKKKIEIHKAQKKQNKDNKVSKKEDGTSIVAQSNNP